MPTILASPHDRRTAPEPPRLPASARMLFAVLSRMDRGRLEWRTPDRRFHRFGPGGEAVPSAGSEPAAIDVARWRVATRALKGGDVGFAESYMDGEWTTPDLVRLLAVLGANQPALERAFYGNAWMRALLRVRHWLNANTKRGAKRNIAAHYDLGNDFYSRWLDRTMTYSSALFEGDATRSLESAQQAKYDRILSELELAPESQVLEIGCGWGGFAETAALAGHHVTGISLSARQTSWARDRLADAGLQDRSELRLQDYRDVRGTFDGVASIEMIEAVGEKFWPSYFTAVKNALRPGGRACLQAITIADERFERYRTQSDFIQRYVFPGGMLPSPSRIEAEAGRAGLRLVGKRTFGADYAETLRRWLAAFDEHAGEFEPRFGVSFVRCWRFYLAYCAAGFMTGTTDVGHYTFERG